jgi:hypothetical protein
MKFHEVAVNYQGAVVAFAGSIPDSAEERQRPILENLLTSNIYVDVLALNPEENNHANNNARDWVGFQPLAFANTVRPADMQIDDVPDSVASFSPHREDYL